MLKHDYAETNRWDKTLYRLDLFFIVSIIFLVISIVFYTVVLSMIHKHHSFYTALDDYYGAGTQMCIDYLLYA
jgi:hypothetical protein